MDPLVALEPVAVDVDLGDFTYTIPALPAARWLVAVTSEEGSAIIPGLLAEQDRRDIWAEFAKGALTPEEIADAARDALEVAAGRPWWEADRLIRSAFTKASWPVVSGEMTHRGIDVSRISLAAWLNWVYVLVITRCKDDAERSRFEAQLQAIPKGVEPERIADDDDMASAFMDALNEQSLLG